MTTAVLLLSLVGAFAFGLVIGWTTYRTLRRTPASTIGDIAAVIGAVGGAAVTALFPAQTGAFGMYCIGLALGFFGYLASALVLASKAGQASTVNEWLGERPHLPPSSSGGQLPPAIVPSTTPPATSPATLPPNVGTGQGAV